MRSRSFSVRGECFSSCCICLNFRNLFKSSLLLGKMSDIEFKVYGISSSKLKFVNFSCLSQTDSDICPVKSEWQIYHHSQETVCNRHIHRSALWSAKLCSHVRESRPPCTFSCQWCLNESALHDKFVSQFNAIVRAFRPSPHRTVRSQAVTSRIPVAMQKDWSLTILSDLIPISWLPQLAKRWFSAEVTIKILHQ